MGATEDLWWTGAEGARVQGHLIKPPNFDPSKKYPIVNSIYPGPQSGSVMLSTRAGAASTPMALPSNGLVGCGG